MGFACTHSGSHDDSRLSSLRALPLLFLLFCVVFRLVSWPATPHTVPLTFGGGWVELLVWVAVVWFLLAVVVPPSCLFFVVSSCLFVVCLAPCCWVPSVMLDPVTIWSRRLPCLVLFLCFECLVVLSSVCPLGFGVANIGCPDDN